jgi:diguanylate cyclase (GGDEF)-like protein
MKVTAIVPSDPKPPFEQKADDPSFAMARRLRVPVWVFDIDHSRIVFANESACALWNAENEEELRSRNLGADMSITVARRLKQYQTDFRESDATFTELWTLYPNGVPKSLMVIYRGFVLPDGRLGMQCEAVAEAEDQPHNLRSAEALLHTDVHITLFSKEGPPLYLNPAARNAFPTQIRSLAELFVDLKDFDMMVAQLDFLGEHRQVSRVRLAGCERWFDLSAKSCSDAVTGKPAILLTAIDVTELKEARDTARHLADRDQLTDLHNRSYLQSHLIKLASRPATSHSAIIFFDVDRFKAINDHYGHEAGDLVLRQIAARMRAELRPGDLAVRLGGDEFVALVDEVSNSADAEQLALRLHNATSQQVMLDNTAINVTTSVGVAVFTPSLADFTEVLREADIALYASKQAGRNRVTNYTAEMGLATKAREDMEFELRRAIDQREFELFYQPRLDIRTGQIVAVEGLARWNHPTRGLVMPSEFIPICEETGLIEDLGRLVLDIGCRQAIAWRKAGLDLSVSLNVSPRQFGGDGLLDILSDYAAMPGFPKGKVELEITESVLIGDPVTLSETLRTITTMGYRIAIDDFGTGYSNLSFISHFPLTFLKIDHSFIQQLPQSGPIVRLILTLAQQIGATVVSEGVETDAQLEWLARHNCDQAQGHLIARPMQLANLNAFLTGFQG